MASSELGGAFLGLRTTLLNPTLWLLAVLAIRAAVAVGRGETAQRAFERVRRGLRHAPVLALLALAVVGALGSRLVLGYLAPGSYAEEVLAARSFLSAHESSGGAADFSRWLQEEPAPITPWTLPGVTECQASALESRSRFYTAQGHSPALLLAAVPVVAVGGGHVLYLTLAVLSLTALCVIAVAFARAWGMSSRSASTVMLLLALGGWQPVLAGIRQGDVVVAVAGLVVAAWALLVHRRERLAGLTTGVAVAIFLPATVMLIALGLCSRRSLAYGLSTLGAVLGATLLLAGPEPFAQYAASNLASARHYSTLAIQYSMLGRLIQLNPLAQASAVWIAFALIGITTTVVFTRGTGAAEGGRRLVDRHTVDSAMAMFAAVAFLLVPVAWSQHLALLTLPLAVLLQRVLAWNRPWGLLSWAVMATLISLPDNAIVWLGLGLGLTDSATMTAVLPPVPLWVAVGLWAWLGIGTITGRRRSAEGHLPTSAGVPVTS